MIKNISLFVFLVIFAIACAIQPTPDNVDMAECGDGVCNGDEDSESCPADCNDDSPVCGDGVCEGDEHIYNCPEDCLGDTPPDESDSWIWRGGVDSSRNDYIEGSANPLYWNGNIPPETVWAVGDCHALGIHGWLGENGNHLLVTKHEFVESDGTKSYWYSIYREDTTPTPGHSVSEKCVLSLFHCTNDSRSPEVLAKDPGCWMQYGREVDNQVDYYIAGPYRICDAEESCGVAMRWIPGDTPQPVGN